MAVEPMEIRVSGSDIPLVARVPRAAGTYPALVIMPSIFGVPGDLIEQMEEIAETGALVVALDPFWRVQPGPMPYDDVAAAFARLRETDLRQSFDDLLATVEEVRVHPRASGRVIGLGICFGGPFCFNAAARGKLDGVVTWHGSRLHEALERAADMPCPMKLHFGEVDPVVPLETVAQIRQAFQNREDVEIAVHPGATHGFSHRSGPAYQREAEAAGMQAVRALLAAMSG